MNLLKSEQDVFYTPLQLKKLDTRRIPQHVAIIPDGNRRWAKRNFLLPEQGHRAGADQLMDIVQAASELGIKALTFYIFSTENWQRPQREIKAQLWLLEKYLIEQRQRMIDNGVRFSTIGELTPFPDYIHKAVKETVEATKHCDKIDVNFALNYGGRSDIVRAVRKIVEEQVKMEDITENLIAEHLDTKYWPDPDLLIRTSGELRVSNFLLWQISYSEIYVTDALWPEFTPDHLLEAVYSYQSRERRLGGT